MIITNVKFNHLVNPLGYCLEHPTVSYVVEEAKGKHQVWARVEVSLTEDFSEVLYDTEEREDIKSTGFEIPLELLPKTRYFVRVTVMDDAGDSATSNPVWFETAKSIGSEGAAWKAKWITPDADKSMQAAVYQDIHLRGPVCSARAYGVGLGLYELYVNGEKQGEECLLPGFCDYDTWIGYQTYELGLKEGTNRIEMLLGDGWYKGWYGLRKTRENYGDALAAILEIEVVYEDGSQEIFGTDSSWKARRSQIVESGDRKSTRLNSSHNVASRMPSSA